MRATPQSSADLAECHGARCRAQFAACDEDTKSEIVVPVFGRNYHNEADVPADSDVPKKVSSSARAHVDLFMLDILRLSMHAYQTHGLIMRLTSFHARIIVRHGCILCTQLIAVLDIDADVVGAFDNCDAVYLERICERYF